MFWVDNFHLVNYLADRGIYPVKEIDGVAYYHDNKRLHAARRDYSIERAFYNSHKFER